MWNKFIRLVCQLVFCPWVGKFSYIWRMYPSPPLGKWPKFSLLNQNPHPLAALSPSPLGFTLISAISNSYISQTVSSRFFLLFFGCSQTLYLMKLGVRVSQPKLCAKPVQLGVVRGPYWIIIAWLLMELDGYWHQVSASFNIEKTQACAHVPSFQILSVLTIVRNVL